MNGQRGGRGGLGRCPRRRRVGHTGRQRHRAGLMADGVTCHCCMHGNESNDVWCINFHCAEPDPLHGGPEEEHYADDEGNDNDTHIDDDVHATIIARAACRCRMTDCTAASVTSASATCGLSI